eukprot:5844040-Amphidinium_carterae.1
MNFTRLWMLGQWLIHQSLIQKVRPVTANDCRRLAKQPLLDLPNLSLPKEGYDKTFLVDLVVRFASPSNPKDTRNSDDLVRKHQNLTPWRTNSNTFK